MSRTTLEAQLAELMQEFAFRLVEVIRNASFADVAALSVPRGMSKAASSPSPSPRRTNKSGPSPQEPSGVASAARRAGRQTKAHRAELGERVLQTLTGARQPLGVRALSSELGVAPDRLALPLRELRAAGRIHKHGEKRATTYSAD
jgi:hypothetical protein